MILYYFVRSGLMPEGNDLDLNTRKRTADMKPFVEVKSLKVHVKGILCDFFLIQINNKPIPKILHVKTLQNLCQIRY